VIGETAEVGTDVLMYTGVVLGGTSSEHKKRHPTVGNNVVFGTHAIVLGAITIGDGAKVGSGSVVIEPVPPNATVVGVPGRVVRINGRKPERDILDHSRLPDPVVETLKCLVERVESLEAQLRDLRQVSTFDPSGDGHVPVECKWVAQQKES
jgi:serine O-acetyltransferase